MIFDMYLNHVSYGAMVKKLKTMRIKTATGNDVWHVGTLEQMVQNEKYAGHMAYGKTYILNGSTYRTKKLLNNEKMILNHHEPIIDDSIYKQAIALRNSRSKNSKEYYKTLSEVVTPYYHFVYSTVNEKHLKYIVERPKGKYEIPTLYCYDKLKSNRVMVTVRNLFSILNDALNKLKVLDYSLSAKVTEFINRSLAENESILEDADDKVGLISTRLMLKQSKTSLPNYIKRIKSFKGLDDIDSFKKMIDSIILDGNYHFYIKLKVISDDKLNAHIYDSSINLKVGNLIREVKYSVYI